jgi:anti-sigma regulatory factor (Ser/Thr protein kinase)
MPPIEQQWTSTAGGSGPVDIRLPADPALVPAIRLTASGMSVNAKCTVDEIEDVKLAVSEVLLALIEHTSARSLTITLQAHDGEFCVTGRGSTDGYDPEHPDLGLSRVVLAEVCSAHSIDHVDSEMRIAATVRIERNDAN